MTNFDRYRAEAESRRYAADVLHPTRFGEAINRYVGAAGYVDPYAAAPADTGAVRTAPAAPVRPPTGVALVGVDESPISCVALDHAAIEAELHGWALRIVNVRRSGADGVAEKLLRRLSDRVHASVPSVTVASRLLIGSDPAKVLLAEAQGTDIVVIGHWHGATATAFGRSVADRVGRQHTGPVLVVRMPGWPVGPEWGARPIVVGVDGSPPSHAAVEFALTEARVRGCDVTLLHVAGDGMDLAHRLETRETVRVHHKIVSGDPVTALVEASGESTAVVVGRHGHGALPGPLLTAATHVLPQQALCPVFLVG